MSINRPPKVQLLILSKLPSTTHIRPRWARLTLNLSLISKAIYWSSKVLGKDRIFPQLSPRIGNYDKAKNNDNDTISDDKPLSGSKLLWINIQVKPRTTRASLTLRKSRTIPSALTLTWLLLRPGGCTSWSGTASTGDGRYQRSLNGPLTCNLTTWHVIESD